MRHPQVSWHEGQFLRPHHLQAADRYWSEINHLSGDWSRPANYGIRLLEFSSESLANNNFELRRVHARMPDGAIVRIDAGQAPDRIEIDREHLQADLADGFQTESTLLVYLAVPRLKMGRENTADVGTPDSRYHHGSQLIPDENGGGNDQEIQVRYVNVQLRLSTQDLSGFDVLPLVRLKRAGSEASTPEVDSTYVPPLLAVDASVELERTCIRGIFDVISQKADVLSQQIQARNVGFESRHPGDLDRIFMLAQLNEAICSLRQLAFGNGIHPLQAYIELCRIVGSLSVFSAGRLATELPLYDHDNLGPIFETVRQKILTLLSSVQAYEFEQRFFTGVGMGLQVSLKSSWFHSDWEWFIGVKKGDLNADQIMRLLAAGQLDWKLGSSRQVESLFQHRAKGLELVPLERQVRALPSDEDWLFYEVPRQDSHAWQDVQVTETLAMRLKDSLILNFDQLQGMQTLVVNAGGRRTNLEFALFAVQRKV